VVLAVLFRDWHTQQPFRNDIDTAVAAKIWNILDVLQKQFALQVFTVVVGAGLRLGCAEVPEGATRHASDRGGIGHGNQGIPNIA